MCCRHFKSGIGDKGRFHQHAYEKLLQVQVPKA